VPFPKITEYKQEAEKFVMEVKQRVNRNTFRNSCCAMLVVLSIGLITGCSSPYSPVAVEANPQVVESLQRFTRDYTLQAGDQVEVYVYRHPDFSKTVTIRPDGYLTLPVLDDIKAAGLTPMELDRLVTKALSVRLKEPEVSVFVENVVEPMVYVHGEVQVASAIPIRKAKTVAQALAQVGGIKREAKVEQLAVIRLHKDGHLRAITLELANHSQSSYFLAMQNIRLLPEDIIFVPESHRSQFVRAIQDFINTPLTGVNQVLAPYFQFRLIEELDDVNETTEVIIN
jgi:protein involved in polysaccharide export with SLBB domain